ncbi:MAG: phosphatidate cytidylyltransferase [Planctomycetes bacterium]|nr:phosphatidate cytidylyltransferase [Planctomycetota bacterium]
MLRWRLISAAVVLTILITLVWADYAHNFGAPGVWLAPLALVLTMLATGELLAMYRHGGHKPAGWAMYAGNVMVLLAAMAPLAWSLRGEPYPPDCPLGTLGWPLAATALAVLLTFVAEMQRYQEPGGVTANIALAALAVAYVGLLMSFLIALRLFGGNAVGVAALLSMIIAVKLGDTGAYTVGRLIGGKVFGARRLAPRLSPKKTWEGAAGAVVFSCVGAWLTFRYLVPWLTGSSLVATPWWSAAAYGGVLSIVGMIGDLAESLLKRDLGVKDSSTWLPGLGGVLDLLDSLLAAAPVAFLFWASGFVRA